jgi:two-component system sensor histidine kinase AlgZ
MADKRQLVPLKAELDLAEKYLYLEKIRLGDRLEISSKIDTDTVGIKVPVFLLQPLLENAVYHGIETRFKGGKISLNIAQKNNELVIKITNPLPESGVKRKSGNKVAQQNLRERIRAVFGRRASLESHEAETSFNVVVRLPL